MSNWTKEKIDILRAYLEGGLSNSVIASKFKVSPDSIDHTIRRYNLSKFRKVEKEQLPILDLEELNDDNWQEQKEAAKLKWKVPKTKIAANKKKVFKQFIVIPDLHAPKQNTPSVNIYLQVMDDIKFDGLIEMGDLVDLSCISHWNETKHKTLEGQRLKNDYICANAILDEFDKRLPYGAEKYYLKGNHEDWANQLVEKIPALEGLFDVESCLKLNERGYKIFEYNDILKLGKMNFTHGMYCSQNPIAKHVNELKVNIGFAHTHTLGMQCFSSPARDVAFVGYNFGSGCDWNPDYMKNAPHKWVHGFGIFYLFPDKTFDVSLIRIIQGKAIVNGKLYNGN
jgi:transposase-like protein